MSFESDLRAHLLHASITAHVGERIWPVVRRAETLPALTYQRIAGVPQTDIDGDDGDLMNIRTQIDVWALSHDLAKTVAEAVRLRMQTAGSTIRAVMLLDQDLYEDETRMYRVLMDFSCWYRTG